MKRLAVFGGSFNPPTNTHMSLAEQILDEYADELLFLPVGNYYEKKELLHSEHRLSMLQSICRTNPRFTVSDIEINSERRLYTVESLQIIADLNAEKELFFIMGTDNLQDFPNWKSPDKILQLCGLLVIARYGNDPDTIIQANPILRQNRDRIKIAKENIRNDCSSTHVRNLLSQGKSIRYLVPDEVFYYIQKHQLYGVKAA